MSLDRAEFDRLLASVLAQLGFQLDSHQADMLYKHYQLLGRWSRRINLTSISDPEKVVFRHFGESLAVAKLIGPGVGRVVDIGAGAGFPGVPVAVCWPHRQVTLVESAGKKAVFLKEIERIQPNLTVYEGRFEQYQGQAEWAIMRAVGASGVETQVRKVAQWLAFIGSAAKAFEVARQFGLAEIEERSVPWDARTVIVSGEIIARARST